VSPLALCVAVKIGQQAKVRLLPVDARRPGLGCTNHVLVTFLALHVAVLVLFCTAVLFAVPLVLGFLVLVLAVAAAELQRLGQTIDFRRLRRHRLPAPPAGRAARRRDGRRHQKRQRVLCAHDRCGAFRLLGFLVLVFILQVQELSWNAAALQKLEKQLAAVLWHHRRVLLFAVVGPLL